MLVLSLIFMDFGGRKHTTHAQHKNRRDASLCYFSICFPVTVNFSYYWQGFLRGHFIFLNHIGNQRKHPCNYVIYKIHIPCSSEFHQYTACITLFCNMNCYLSRASYKLKGYNDPCLQVYIYTKMS